MIITCPDCETQFLVDIADIAPDGRDVRCSRCGYQWYVAPVIEKPAPAMTAAAAPGAEATTSAASSSVTPSVAAQEALSDDYQSRLPVPVSVHGPGWRLLLSLILLLGMAAIIAGLYMERQRIMDTWPPARTIYERLGLTEAALAIPATPVLQLRDVRLSEAAQALKLSGLISGPSQAALAAKVVIKVEDADGNELYQSVIAGADLIDDPQGARFAMPLPALP